MARSQKERFIEALEARGSVILSGHPRAAHQGTHPHSRKYVVMSAPLLSTADFPTYYFIGSAGALRRGPSVTGSLPMSEKFKQMLLASVPE